MNMKHIKIITAIIVTALLPQTQLFAQQQMENSMSQYFRNPMLWNAANTGANGNKIYALQNRSWIGFDGAPVLTNLTGEFQFGENSAAGINVISDVTGILKRTYGVFNYAYRVKLTEENQIRLGVSFAFAGDRLKSDYIDQGGSPDPLLVNNVSSSVNAFDGNVGAVYTDKRLSIGASIFRLSENLTPSKGGNANLAMGQLGVSYKFFIGGDEKMELTPLAMWRLYRTTDDLVDVGAQFEYSKKLHVMALYQSSGNIRMGAGVRLLESVEANFFYNSNNKVSNVSSQQFEVGIGFHFKDKKK